ncbi:hypothetical protein [Microbacterium sp. 179-I 3D4 NHS]|uniref:hypothetical protein n=1 Tax=Microbacterium sp. 179-I 3D4 NHS TaxID=3142381 RepID=UPI0039A01474
MRHATLPELRTLLIDRRRLEGDGHTSRSIRVAIDSGRLHVVRRGWFVPADEWALLWPESRHRAEVLATALSATTTEPVFSHLSAAVLWDLPLWRMQPRRVHVMVDRRHHRHSVPGILRHEGVLPDDDVAVIDGIRCTNLSRTVYDVIRTVRAEAALVAGDAALARIGGDPWAFDDDAAAAWTASLHARLRLPGARGIVAARRIADLMDGRAQLPLESVTRYRLHQQGFSRMTLQRSVARPDGGLYWLDIAIDDARTFVECDGKEKYTDPALRGRRSMEQVLFDEKSREDWIRGTTGWRIVRVGSDDMRTAESAAARFRAFGLLPGSPERPDRLAEPPP